jgi:hypothetical protein
MVAYAVRCESCFVGLGSGYSAKNAGKIGPELPVLSDKAVHHEQRAKYFQLQEIKLRGGL